MFFTASKVFWMVFQPLTLIALVCFLGLLAFRYKFGKGLLAFGASLFLLCGFSPVGNNLLWYLEGLHPTPQSLPEKVDGIIVLGGAVDIDLSFSHNYPQVNDNAERIFEGLKLSRLYPQAKIVFSGGSGSLSQSSGKESTVMKILLKNIGYSSSQIQYEDASRNTYENMLYSMRTFHPHPQENWVLVTSAFHMPRSVAIFESNGWPIIPYPAGYISSGKYEIFPNLDVLGNYYKLQVAVREIVGIIAYSLTERIKPDDNEERPALPSSAASAPADAAGTR